MWEEASGGVNITNKLVGAFTSSILNRTEWRKKKDCNARKKGWSVVLQGSPKVVTGRWLKHRNFKVLKDTEDVVAKLPWSNYGKVPEDPTVKFQSLGLSGYVEIAKVLSAVGEDQ